MMSRAKYFSVLGIVVVGTALMAPLSWGQASVEIDLDASSPGTSELERTVAPGATISGQVVLNDYQTLTAFSVVFAFDQAGSIDTASIGTGCIQDMGNPVSVTPLTNLPQQQIGGAIVFTFGNCDASVRGTVYTFDIDLNPSFQGDILLSFKTDAQQYIASGGSATLISAIGHPDSTIHVGPVGPTDTPTEIPPPTVTPTTETTFTPTPTEIIPPTVTPTTETTFTPTPTETPLPPTPTPTTPAEEFALVAVDAYQGIHPAGGLSVNLNCYTEYFHPMHVARDADLTSNQRGIMVVDAFGHVHTYSLTEICLPQIPNQTYYSFPFDTAVAVEAETPFAAYILIDTGEIIPVGTAPDTIPDVSPALPWRAGVSPVTAEFDPGPAKGPLRIGTIAPTGGWEPESAIDFTLTGSDGALVLARNGRIHQVGSAEQITFGQSHSVWLWPDLARRIEYMNVGGEDYYIVLDGLGGVHMGGPTDSALRTSFNSRVLNGDLTYFAGVVTSGTGSWYVGIDAANDFIPILHTDNTEIGILMLDGLGGIHKANVPFAFEPTVYFPAPDPHRLDTMISLLKADVPQ